MGEDFVRCYIGDGPFFALKGVQRDTGRLDDWDLMQGSEFEHKRSYGYKEIFARDESLIEALARRSVIAENRRPETSKPSVIWSNALLIADVVTLLSLARGKYYPMLVVEKNLGDKYSIGWGVMTRETKGNRDIVPSSNLAKFISESLALFEQNPSWLRDSGFDPGIFWYVQAQQPSPSVLEIALYWVSMEIVAGAHIDRLGLSIVSKKERVKRFVIDRGYTGNCWDFLDEVVDDWYETRCAAFHEGRQTLPVEKLKTRRQQVHDFASLVFVEMLQQQEEAQRTEIAARMRNY